MQYCPECGTQIEPGKSFCPSCGKEVTASNAPQMPPPAESQKTVHVANSLVPPDMKPPMRSRYAPVSVGSFLGMMLLMYIPVVNIILLIVWAIGARKVNKRNWAIAYLLVAVIGVVISLLLYFFAGNALYQFFLSLT